MLLNTFDRLRPPVSIFKSRRSAQLFGTEFSVRFPFQPEEEFAVDDMVSGVNLLPGKEHLGFYDYAYDLTANRFVELHASFDYSFSINEREDLQPFLEAEVWPSPMLATRCWYRAATRYKDNYFRCEFWITRSDASRDLREGDHLKNLHQHLLNLDALRFDLDRESFEETFYDYDDPNEPEFEKEERKQHAWHNHKREQLTRFLGGVNWTTETKGNRRWLGYEEYENKGFRGESWLTPIGPHHYLRVRLYVDGGLAAKSDFKAFERYSNGVMESIRVFSSPEVLKLPAHDHEADVITVAGLDSDSLGIVESAREELEAKTRKDKRLQANAALYDSGSLGIWIIPVYFMIPVFAILFMVNGGFGLAKILEYSDWLGLFCIFYFFFSGSIGGFLKRKVEEADSVS